MKLKLYNLNHDFAAPAAADKPIFLPFGTWGYDAQISQTFDREHALAIANELAAAIAKGEPGIPVYQRDVGTGPWPLCRVIIRQPHLWGCPLRP